MATVVAVDVEAMAEDVTDMEMTEATATEEVATVAVDMVVDREDMVEVDTEVVREDMAVEATNTRISHCAYKAKHYSNNKSIFRGF